MLAFRLRETEDEANVRMGERAVREDDMSAPSAAERSLAIGELINWYLEEVTYARAGGDVAAVLLERKKLKLVIKHLLNAQRDQPAFFYAEEYGEEVAFEDKRILLNPVRVLRGLPAWPACTPAPLPLTRQRPPRTHAPRHTPHPCRTPRMRRGTRLSVRFSLGRMGSRFLLALNSGILFCTTQHCGIFCWLGPCSGTRIQAR